MRDVNDNLLYGRIKRILPIIQERMNTANNGEQFQANQDPCPIHNVPMKRYTKGNQSWLSHQLADGTWCRGK
jgi:hypothetical protein